MAQYNIEMNSYNGSSYDQLYPTVNLANVTGKLTLSNTTETLSISRGGTGATNANSAMYNLINGLSSLSSPAINDYIAVQDVSAGSSGGRKVTLSNLINAINNSNNFLVKKLIKNNVKIFATESQYTSLGITINSLIGYFPIIFKISGANGDSWFRIGSDSGSSGEYISVNPGYNFASIEGINNNNITLKLFNLDSSGVSWSNASANDVLYFFTANTSSMYDSNITVDIYGYKFIL